MSTIASTGAISQVNFGIGNSRRLPSQVNEGIGNNDVTTLAIPNTLKATETPSTMAISFTTSMAMNTGSAGTGSVSDFITITADSAVWNDAASGTCEVTLGGVAKTTTCAITTPTTPPANMGGTVLTVTVGETIAPGAVVVTVKADFAANAAEPCQSVHKCFHVGCVGFTQNDSVLHTSCVRYSHRQNIKKIH